MDSVTSFDKGLHRSWASLVAQRLKRLPAVRETWVRSIPGSGRSPGEGNGNPLQYSCLENPMDGVDYTVHGVTKGRTRLSNLTNYIGLRVQRVNNLGAIIVQSHQQRSIFP